MSVIGEIRDLIQLFLSWKDRKKRAEQEALKAAEVEKQKNLKPAALAIQPETRKNFTRKR